MLYCRAIPCWAASNSEATDLGRLLLPKRLKRISGQRYHDVSRRVNPGRKELIDTTGFST